MKIGDFVKIDDKYSKYNGLYGIIQGYNAGCQYPVLVDIGCGSVTFSDCSVEVLSSWKMGAIINLANKQISGGYY